MDAILLKQSFDLIVPQKEAFAETFYTALFERYPQTQSLFVSADMQQQQRALIFALVFVVSGVVRGDDIAPTVQQLGQRHGTYGVKAEHYTMVGEVLLATLQQFLKEQWTPQVEETWIGAYTTVSTLMQQPTND